MKANAEERGTILNSYERLFSRLENKPVDRPPNLNILISFAAKYSNVPFSKFCLDSKSMVEANLICHEDFGIDAVTTLSDPYAETEDFGAIIEYPYNSNPISRNLFLQDYSDIQKLKTREIGESNRMLNRVRTVEMYKERVKGQCPIIGLIAGPLVQAVCLRGMNQTFIDLIEAPNFIAEVIEVCTVQAISFAKAQMLAGADIIALGEAPSSFVGGDIYRRMILPCEKRIVDEVHKYGGKVKLHTCGNSINILRDVLTTGADIIDIDWMVDYKKAIQISNGKASINGNVDPVGVMLNGTEIDVENAVFKCLDCSDSKNIISAGCEIPAATNPLNIKAFSEAIKKRYPIQIEHLF